MNGLTAKVDSTNFGYTLLQIRLEALPQMLETSCLVKGLQIPFVRKPGPNRAGQEHRSKNGIMHRKTGFSEAGIIFYLSVVLKVALSSSSKPSIVGTAAILKEIAKVQENYTFIVESQGKKGWSMSFGRYY